MSESRTAWIVPKWSLVRSPGPVELPSLKMNKTILTGRIRDGIELAAEAGRARGAEARLLARPSARRGPETSEDARVGRGRTGGIVRAEPTG